MILNRGKEKKIGSGRAKSRKWMKIPFSCLRRVCLFFTLADCTYLLYMLCCVMYLEEVILVKFYSLIFSLLLSSSILPSSILRVYKQHVIDGRDKECLPFSYAMSCCYITILQYLHFISVIVIAIKCK